MLLHRIFTEDKNPAQVRALILALFPGFTLFRGDGYWRGCQEKSLIIEIITDQSEKINLLAGRIKRLNKQESVLVETIQNHAEFV